MKPALFILVILVLTSCVSSAEQKFLTMSESELAAYNASMPEMQQVVCHEGIRRGTVGLLRKVCTSKSRMARLQNGSDRNSPFTLSNPGFYGSRSFNTDRTPGPRVFFSPPPPGFDKPIIHVFDYRH